VRNRNVLHCVGIQAQSSFLIPFRATSRVLSFCKILFLAPEAVKFKFHNLFAVEYRNPDRVILDPVCESNELFFRYTVTWHNWIGELRDTRKRIHKLLFSIEGHLLTEYNKPLWCYNDTLRYRCNGCYSKVF